MKFGEILTKKHEMDVMSLEEGKVHIEKVMQATFVKHSIM